MSFPSGIWNGAPAKIEFCVLYCLYNNLVTTVLLIFLRINRANLVQIKRVLVLSQGLEEAGLLAPPPVYATGVPILGK